MTDRTPHLPAWILDRRGELTPFEPDQLRQALFAATEDLGRADAFLASELTEGILHFLPGQIEGTPTSEQIDELAVKVVRELGQPALAHAFEQRRGRTEQPAAVRTIHSRDVIREALEKYSRQFVFSRDLLAAQDDGWITILGLEDPNRLLARVLPWPAGPANFCAAFLEEQKVTGGWLALDGLEWAVEPKQSFEPLIAQLRAATHGGEQRLIVNLNPAKPPAWADAATSGPLFGDGETGGDRAAIAWSLARALLREQLPGLRVDFHLTESDFANANKTSLWNLLGEHGLQSDIRFVFDRPKRPVALAEGLDRRQSAVLQAVAAHLPPLADLPGVASSLDTFLAKLPGLARLAVATGVQKRQFLRQKQNLLQKGFLLERAGLLVVPVGLEACLRRFGDTADGTLGQKVIRTFAQHLRQAGQQANFDVVLDSPWWLASSSPSQSGWFTRPHLEGLSHADPSAEPREQLRRAGLLHADAGTAWISGAPPSAESLLQLLHFAWKKTDVVRVGLHR